MTNETTPAALRFSDGLGAWGRDDLMAMAAVRYCLGRSSYIVGDCCEWLPTVWDKLRPNARAVIARDVDAEIKRDDEARARGDTYKPLGMDMDREMWVAVRALWDDTLCKRVVYMGRLCGLRGPCLDCGLALHDVPDGA